MTLTIFTRKRQWIITCLFTMVSGIDMLFADIFVYRWLFSEFLRGRAGRYAQSRNNPSFHIIIDCWLTNIIGFHHEHHRPERDPESEEEYQARLKRSREEQVAAEERRKKEDAERKARLEKERIRGELLFFRPCHRYP